MAFNPAEETRIRELISEEYAAMNPYTSRHQGAHIDNGVDTAFVADDKATAAQALAAAANSMADSANAAASAASTAAQAAQTSASAANVAANESVKTVNNTPPDANGNVNTASTGGTGNHAELANLGYAQSGHTGFSPTVHGHGADDVTVAAGVALSAWFTAVNADLSDLADDIDTIKNLGSHVGTFNTRAAVPANASGFSAITINDFVNVRIDETRDGATTRYIASAIAADGAITWTFDIAYDTDITGKMDTVPGAVDGNLAMFDDEKVVDSGIPIETIALKNEITKTFFSIQDVLGLSSWENSDKLAARELTHDALIEKMPVNSRLIWSMQELIVDNATFVPAAGTVWQGLGIAFNGDDFTGNLGQFAGLRGEFIRYASDAYGTNIHTLFGNAVSPRRYETYMFPTFNADVVGRNWSAVINRNNIQSLIPGGGDEWEFIAL